MLIMLVVLYFAHGVSLRTTTALLGTFIGLLVAGLGVLNDVTMTQSSAVWEIKAAQPTISARNRFAAGMRIGRDHIASTVYTIALAYAGAALPMLLVVSLYERPMMDTLMDAEIVEEVVRILVGSVGLVLTIPITTGIAVAVTNAVAEPAGQRPRSAVVHDH